MMRVPCPSKFHFIKPPDGSAVGAAAILLPVGAAVGLEEAEGVNAGAEEERATTGATAKVEASGAEGSSFSGDSGALP
jgi:hypothetical protein